MPASKSTRSPAPQSRLEIHELQQRFLRAICIVEVVSQALGGDSPGIALKLAASELHGVYDEVDALVPVVAEEARS